MVETIKAISEINAVSGDEKSIRQYILKNANADEISVDNMGNIVALKKGTSNEKRKVAIVTQIDECGMIVTDITDEGYIKFDLVGDVQLRSIISKPVIIKNSIKGIIGMKAVHLQKKEERENVKEAKELYIDIGANSKKEALTLVKKGDYISFLTKFTDLDCSVKGKALDRVGIYGLLSAMNEAPYYDTYFVFTVQKEVGTRGAMIAANKINPDTVIVFDTVTANDSYGTENEDITVKSGGGAVISYTFLNAISDREISKKMISIAEENNIKTQIVSVSREKSDAGEIIVSGNGTKTASIAIPIRYSHTPVQLVSKKDIESATKLLALLLKSEDI